MNKEMINNLFTYQDGHLYSKETGLQVGSKANTGYLRIGISKKYYQVHRLIWEMHYEKIPDDKIVDHIDRNKSNNFLENLRLASRTENQMNSEKRDSTAPFKGISWHKARKKWNAKISYEKKRIHLGYYDSAEEAFEAYCFMGKTLYGDNFYAGQIK
jgi:hypothetical protein